MFKKSLLFIIICSSIHGLTYSQNKEISLWNEIPNSIENNEYQEEFRYDNNGTINAIKKVKKPTLKLFLVDSNRTDNTAVVICPGGGYSVLSHIKEGEHIAKWLNSIGVSAIVLKYRLPSDLIMKNKSIGPLQDAQESIRTIRRNARNWNIDPNKIGIMGFSAGGHLAATLSTQFEKKIYESDNTSARPNFSILIYPVISMKDSITHQGSKIKLLGKNSTQEIEQSFSNELNISTKTPPSFIVHSLDDKAVVKENSTIYFKALEEKKISAEIHLYKDGGHGYGLGKIGEHNKWPNACNNWLINQGFIEPNESLKD